MNTEKPPQKIAVATLGCKVNQYETAAIMEAMPEAVAVPFDDQADVYVINTCAVTAKSEYQSRQLVRRAIRNNPAAKVVVTGCYAQIAPDVLKRIPGVSAIIGNAEKETIPELLRSTAFHNFTQTSGDSTATTTVEVGNIQKVRSFDQLRARNIPQRTRGILRIQDGCNSVCTYCTIPLARGKSRSMQPEDVLSEIAAFTSNGHQEIVLTGIHLGAYGADLRPPTSLSSLLQRILASRHHPRRIRLSSIEPSEVTAELLSLLAEREQPLCPHLHIPMQSGDDEILKLMGRDYTASFFAELIERIVAKIPDIAIGTDVIVGFPYESEQHFSNTRNLIKRLPLAYCHVFPFSPRPGTVAAAMGGMVEEREKQHRGAILRALAATKRQAFGEKLAGRKMTILAEGGLDKRTGYIRGASDCYQTIFVKDAQGNHENRFVEVVVEAVEQGQIIGTFRRFAD